LRRSLYWVIGVTLIFSLLLACFRKKRPAHNLESRLEELFPGQFQIVVSNLDLLDVMNQYKGEKRAIIGDKSDPDVQFVLNWQKRSDTLGVDAETVRREHEKAKTDIAQARKLFALLKDHRLERFSVSVIDQGAIIQVFAEPIPATREQTLRTIKAALDTRAEPSQTSIFIELMEPEAYHVKFQDVIPRGHWLTGDGWQKDEKTTSIDFVWSKALNLQKLRGEWTVNTESKRSQRRQEQSFQEAVAWAERNLPSNYYVDADKPFHMEVAADNGLVIRYGFPYFAQKPVGEDIEPLGYICGRYDTDKGTFSQLRKQTEF
jgi:hypothetical protein